MVHRLKANVVSLQLSEQSPLLSSNGRSSSATRACQARNDGTAASHAADSRQDLGDKRGWSRVRDMAIFAWALVATTAVIVLAVWTQHNQQTTRPHHGQGASKRNLVFMVSDGMGPASVSMARSFGQFVHHVGPRDTLRLDAHLWGSSRTRSSNSLVTDSAAGATAFACGKKSYNGAISMLPDYRPCASVLEAAKRAGYATGLVVTTDVTDATPACFASHVLLRQMQDEIALQEIGQGPLGRSVDLIFGGGRCHFVPNTTAGSCRADNVDVVALARKQHGWTYMDSRKAFDALDSGQRASLPLLGLFAPTDVPFELDRRHMAHVYPSLAEMTRTALGALAKATAHTDKGFFLLVEGSRIDHAGHINDPAAQVHEVLEYDAAFAAVMDFWNDSDTETLVVGTSDHETGGLATALELPDQLPVYAWYPHVLANASASCELLSARLKAHVAANAPRRVSRRALCRWINDELILPGLGIADASDSELNHLADDTEGSAETFAAMISRRARIGWSTHGHSAVDVNTYSSGATTAASAIRGNVENTDIGRFLAHYLDVDVDELTNELRNKTPVHLATAHGLHDSWQGKRVPL
ncbi:hypothetical protein CDD81_5142 [Ophiocordyceps australis]|uniref:Alkaline phosphatase n=1 Tax=Ophiocordyceps australis TaxID=1399860 RepID=A0A2C5XDI1_9HYPO|nr:hypothetical protein CDD81_5142 [Ophiocordyceps australis]